MDCASVSWRNVGLVGFRLLVLACDFTWAVLPPPLEPISPTSVETKFLHYVLLLVSYHLDELEEVCWRDVVVALELRQHARTGYYHGSMHG